MAKHRVGNTEGRRSLFGGRPPRDDLFERSFRSCRSCGEDVYVLVDSCRGCGSHVELRAG